MFGEIIDSQSALLGISDGYFQRNSHWIEADFIQNPVVFDIAIQTSDFRLWGDSLTALEGLFNFNSGWVEGDSQGQVQYFKGRQENIIINLHR